LIQKLSGRPRYAALTTKIKAKMALDDSVRARAIDVSVRGSTVTLNGTVRSAGERERAVALTRETAGVTRVIDRLEVRAGS
jgi:osmotically-inducible protein OsmY